MAASLSGPTGVKRDSRLRAPRAEGRHVALRVSSASSRQLDGGRGREGHQHRRVGVHRTGFGVVLDGAERDRAGRHVFRDLPPTRPRSGRECEGDSPVVGSGVELERFASTASRGPARPSRQCRPGDDRPERAGDGDRGLLGTGSRPLFEGSPRIPSCTTRGSSAPVRYGGLLRAIRPGMSGRAECQKEYSNFEWLVGVMDELDRPPAPVLRPGDRSCASVAQPGSRSSRTVVASSTCSFRGRPRLRAAFQRPQRPPRGVRGLTKDAIRAEPPTAHISPEPNAA